MNNLENDFYLSANAFKKLSNLRFLEIRSYLSDTYCDSTVRLPDGLESLSNKLGYFRWERYPLESLPLGFCAEKLVKLHMPDSEVAKLWDGVQNVMNLKTIHLRLCLKLVELPDLSMAQNLEFVGLEYCIKLSSIHPSILSLPKLFYLNLTACQQLRSLDGDNPMKSLKHLMLHGCNKLEEFLLSSEEMRRLILIDTGIKTLKLPIGRFNKLEELCLGGSLSSFQISELSCLTSLKKFSLSEFTEGIGKSKLHILFDAWRSLEELYLRYCAVLEIPDNISAMSLLRTLSLRGCKVEGLPNSIKHLSKLKELDLGQCKWLKFLPELPPSITHFYADECTSLETIDFKVMRAIYNNYSSEVKVCYPGSTIPKGFKYSQMAQNFITIELAPPSCDHLLGFASSCILSALGYRRFITSIYRNFHFEDEEIYYEDEKEFPGFKEWKANNVFVWYDPIESILKQTQRRFDEGTAYKFACEFFFGDEFCNRKVESVRRIKGCGIWPIYASELQETVQQMELKLENHTET